jgi:hypothetical protein
MGVNIIFTTMARQAVSIPSCKANTIREGDSLARIRELEGVIFSLLIELWQHLK